MEFLFRFIVGAFGFFMIGVSLFILIKPKMALKALSKFASTNLINYTELSLRLLVGLGAFGLAPYTAYTKLFQICGGFLMVTALILMLIPRRWHHAYAVWWSERLKPWQVRLCTPFSFIFGIAAMWLAVSVI